MARAEVGIQAVLVAPVVERVVRGRGPGRERVTAGEDGKEAVCKVRLLGHMPTASLVEVRLETGRTQQIRAQLAELVNEVAGVPEEDVQLDKSFVDDLDVDSLAMVEIIVGCEEKFGVTIPDEESKNLKTVGDAVAYVEQHS